MALPLPRVVSDVGPGGGIVTAMRGINALTNSRLQNKIDEAKAEYAPYTAYADAASKTAYANMLPYQIRAQVMSNPMLWMSIKDNPDAIKALMANFQQSIPSGNNIFGNINLPSPNQMQNPFMQGGISGMMGGLINKIRGLNSNSLPPGSNVNMGAMPSNVPQSASNVSVPNMNGSLNSSNGNSPSGLVPSAAGDIPAVVQQQVGKFYEQSHKPGTAFYDPTTNQIISTPTNETITANQSAINAAKRVQPQLEKLADSAAPFLNAGGQAGLYYQRAKNFLFPESKTPGKLPTQYAKFHSLLQSSPEALVKSYGLRPTNETIDRMQKVIEPLFGETKEQYKSRIASQLESIKKEQIGIAQQQLSQGFNLSNNENKSLPGTWDNNKEPINEKQLEGQMAPKGTIWMIRPDGMKVPVHRSNVELAKNKYKFRED